MQGFSAAEALQDVKQQDDCGLLLAPTTHFHSWTIRAAFHCLLFKIVLVYLFILFAGIGASL